MRSFISQYFSTEIVKDIVFLILNIKNTSIKYNTMSDPKSISTPATNTVTDTVTGNVNPLIQKIKDDPDLLQKVIAVLALGGGETGGETAPANRSGLLDSITGAVAAASVGDATVEKVDANNNPLFFNSNKNDDSSKYMKSALTLSIIYQYSNIAFLLFLKHSKIFTGSSRAGGSKRKVIGSISLTTRLV